MELPTPKKAKEYKEDDKNHGDEHVTEPATTAPTSQPTGAPELPFAEPDNDADDDGGGDDDDDSEATLDHQVDFNPERLATVELLDQSFYLSAPPGACHYAGADPGYYETRPVYPTEPVELYVTGYVLQALGRPRVHRPTPRS